MQTVELARTGEQVSQLALGCMLMGTATPPDESFAILDRYLDAGGTFLDTADCYTWWLNRGSAGGESEELLGRWFAADRSRRDRVFLATKGSAVVDRVAEVWPAGGEPDWDLARSRFVGAGGDTLRRSVDDSLRRLGVDHIDLYYVHVDDRSTPLEETLAALAEIVAAGKVRYLGWSNVRTWRLERIRQLCQRHGWPAPVAVQQQHSYLRRRAGLSNVSIVDDEQLDYLREHDDLSLVAYSPILKGCYEPDRRGSTWVMEPYQGPDADARLAALDRLAPEVSATPSQLVLAWLLAQQRPRILPLIGPRTLAQYESAITATGITLSREQVELLTAAGA